MQTFDPDQRRLSPGAVVLVVLGMLLGLAAAAVGGYLLGTGSDPDDPVGVGPSEGSAREPDAPGVSECGAGAPVPEPSSIILACADGGARMGQVTWQSWGPRLAVGSATINANDCVPSCAEGTSIDFPVTVVLDRVVESGAGPQFTRLVAIYAERSPNVDREETSVYELPVSSGR